MKLLFNLDVTEGNCVKARPGDYLQSLPVDRQIAEVTESLHRAESAAASGKGLEARAAAEIGVATAREYLARLEQPDICTGASNRIQDE
jgi:hypothetical protein